MSCVGAGRRKGGGGHAARGESGSDLDVIFDTSCDGIWICDGDAKVLRINTASERLNNIRAEDVVGRTMPELLAEGLVDRSVSLRVLKEHRVVNMFQTTRDGVKLMVTGTPVFDDSGRLMRVVVTERDITEIDTLYRELEEQEALKDRFRDQLLEMQRVELESGRIIARSRCYVTVLQQAAKVSGVDSTVLITGESGAGKGVIADLIHRSSSRAHAPMIRINCGAIPESLVESELFGYDRGAFTGALKGGKPGYFEVADGGILFLDEVGELPLSSQVKLLRFLEDGTVMRVGGTKVRELDVRVLAATNRDLEALVKKGCFRLDLYYRLNIIPLRIPALRERTECIPALIHHYMERFRTTLGVERRLRFTRTAMDALITYSYPGNVRELMNLCERLVVMVDGEQVDFDDLPPDVSRTAASGSMPAERWQEGVTLRARLETVEREILQSALDRYGTQARAAEALGIHQATVARKCRKYSRR